MNYVVVTELAWGLQFYKQKLRDSFGQNDTEIHDHKYTLDTGLDEFGCSDEVWGVTERPIQGL